MVVIIGYVGHHPVHNTITLQDWSVETSKAELSWNWKVACLILINTSKMPPFRSLKTTNKEAAKYQLHMEEAKGGIYFIGNSLIEGCWIGHISIRKGQQNFAFEQKNKGQFDWAGISKLRYLIIPFRIHHSKVARRSCKIDIAAVITWH